jgi:hypothetical protein
MDYKSKLRKTKQKNQTKRKYLKDKHNLLNNKTKEGEEKERRRELNKNNRKEKGVNQMERT